VAGEKLFADKACLTCHLSDGLGRAPSLNGLYGAKVLLADGSTVTADEAYLRESILDPKAKIVAGYQPLMPTFQGQMTEEQILNLTRTSSRCKRSRFHQLARELLRHGKEISMKATSTSANQMPRNTISTLRTAFVPGFSPLITNASPYSIWFPSPSSFLSAARLPP